MYHLVFLVALVPVLLWYVGRNRAAIAAGATVPIMAVLPVYVKNFLVFGMFGSSSWLGFGMATVTIHQLQPQDREQLISDGRLNPIARVESPSAVEAYYGYIPPWHPTGIPISDEPVKSTGGINTHHIVYLEADKLYRIASKEVLLVRPQAYLQSIVIAWFAYFRPPRDFFQFEDMRRSIKRFDRIWNIAAFGQCREASGKELRRVNAAGSRLSLVLYTGTFLIVLFPALWIWSAVYIYKGLRGGRSRAQIALMAFLAINIVWTVLVTNFLSSFENNRYRFPTDALYVIVLGTAIQHFLNWRAKRKNASSAS